MKQLSPLVVSGSVAVDRIMSFKGHYSDYLRPEQLEALSVSILVDELYETHGGGGANICYSLALLGEEPVLLGSAGRESDGYMEQLANYGVNIEHVHRSHLPTATFHVITDGQQHQVGGFFPGAMGDSENLNFGPWKAKNPICIVSSHDPDGMRRQVAECVRWGLRLLYDVGQQVSNLPAEDLRAGLDAAELLMVNEYEMAMLAAKTGLEPADIKAQVPTVVTTLGGRGSVVEGLRVGTPVKVPAVKPVRVADPTGAGDAYRAGFVYGWRRGWEWEACAQLGATCAAYAVETDGTQGHTFDLAEVAARYETAFGAGLPED
ncbi:MAG TPA: carbohydrate kinase family protein [Candidatus Saccharimonadia bacterium]|nr:carbohydrate kinase family protein [Candidatus Saccharimonadia bacterium]